MPTVLLSWTRRHFDRGVRKRKHHHRSVVRAEHLGLAHVPHHRRDGRDREAAWSWRRLWEPDGLSVRVLDGVGVVAKVEQRGVEARRRLGSGLHAEVTERVVSVQLSLGRHGEEQRQPAGLGEHQQSSHGKSPSQLDSMYRFTPRLELAGVQPAGRQPRLEAAGLSVPTAAPSRREWPSQGQPDGRCFPRPRRSRAARP